MAEVVKNEISQFLDRLKSVKDLSREKLAKRVAEFGEETARQKYNGASDKESSIIVSSEIGEDGNVKICAEGKQVAYLEYGTGEKGRLSNYQGDLNFGVSFYSNKLGKNVNLKEWTYSYANELTKNKKVVLPKIDGHEAYAQMFNTAQEIKQKFGAKRSK